MFLFIEGFNEVETRYRMSEAKPRHTGETPSLPRKQRQRRKSKEQQPVIKVNSVAAAVQETKESLSNEKKPQRIIAVKKPSKFDRPSTCAMIWAEITG